MDFHLVCKSPTLDYVKGEIVADAEKIAAVIEEGVEHHFVRVAAPPPPPPPEPKADPMPAPEPEPAPEPRAAEPPPAEHHDPAETDGVIQAAH